MRFRSSIAWGAAARVLGLAQKAMPTPAAWIMGMSLAPSPMATVRLRGMPSSAAHALSDSSLRSLVTILAASLPVSLLSSTSRRFAKQ